ncbi:Lrp/AsnC family transcriptional regulator [Kushneria aurantia]|uniref:Lrp/AsnC family transcriptional regulator n=1 Tax=Kushneria aurantia TaxID=504092 RepID=A0ABV6FZT8_9GAMM|nr:Lrp/AsnC family transcriptional regulator [Kushneria aurantia]
MVHLDDIDLEIIRQLWNGRASYSDVSKTLQVSTKTIGKRVKVMTDSSAADITCLIDPFKLHDHGAAFVGFRILPEYRKAALAIIDDLKGVIMAAIVTGKFDIMAIVSFNGAFTYDAFIEVEVCKIPGIKDMETFIAFGSQNFQLRYLLD